MALAGLAGAGAEEAWARLGARTSALWWRAGTALAGVVVLVLAAWPLASGRAQDAQVSYKRIPAAWRQAAAQLDRELPANSRAMVLPGDCSPSTTGAARSDPILPALTTRPVAERAEVPYADLRATDLLWTIDGLVHQQRLLPGQLSPLLSLIGVRSVITATDDDLARSDAPAPADAAAQLAPQPGFARPAHTYGPVTRFAPSTPGTSVALPQVRRYDLPSARGLVRVEPRAQPVIVDGSAPALAGLAAFGALPADRPLLYSADLDAAQLRAELRSGGQLVISDSNRRQAFVTGSLEQNAGPVLTPAQDVSADGLILDPFGRGPDAETVAAYSGVRSVEAPSSPEVVQFAEHAPFAAVDGSPSTAWLADPTLGAGDRWLQVDFDRPRAVPSVQLLPYGGLRQVQVAGRTFAVHPGWNRLSLGPRRASSLRVSLTGVSSGASGISELRIPGVTATEALRLPVDATAALRGTDLRSTGLTYLFERTTGDDPFQRDLAHGPRDVHRPGDAELTMRRVFDVPAARRFSASAWVTPFAQTPDDTLDHLAGYHGAVRATSSSRVGGEPAGAPRWPLTATRGPHGSRTGVPRRRLGCPSRFPRRRGSRSWSSHQRPIRCAAPPGCASCGPLDRRRRWRSPPAVRSRCPSRCGRGPSGSRCWTRPRLRARRPPTAARGHRRDRRAAAGARKRLSPLQRPLRHRPHPGRDGAGAAARLGLCPRVRGRHAAARPVVWEPRDARRRSPPPGGGARGARGRRPAPVLAGAGAGRRRGEHRVGDQSGHCGPRLL